MEIIRNELSEIKESGFYHFHAGNKNIDQLCSLFRRWYQKKVKRGNKFIVFYDYVKLTGESLKQNWGEHQAIGEKIDKLKKLGEELDCPIFTAMQMNRSGENQNRSKGQFADDSSAIALSDRLQWFASFVAIFCPKTSLLYTSDASDETLSLPLGSSRNNKKKTHRPDRTPPTY